MILTDPIPGFVFMRRLPTEPVVLGQMTFLLMVNSAPKPDLRSGQIIHNQHSCFKTLNMHSLKKRLTLWVILPEQVLLFYGKALEIKLRRQIDPAATPYAA